MKKIRIIIEKNDDGFWAYAEGDVSITGGGESVEACKQDVLDCIDTLKDLDELNIPNYLKEDYELIFKFDTQSIFNYYKGIFTNSAFEKITGINQKQIQHYTTGHRKPKDITSKKIETALHKLGRELLAVEL
jgi:hypothetical protein